MRKLSPHYDCSAFEDDDLNNTESTLLDDSSTQALFADWIYQKVFNHFLNRFHCKIGFPIVTQPYQQGAWFEQTSIYTAKGCFHASGSIHSQKIFYKKILSKKFCIDSYLRRWDPPFPFGPSIPIGMKILKAWINTTFQLCSFLDDWFKRRVSKNIIKLSLIHNCPPPPLWKNARPFVFYKI